MAPDALAVDDVAVAFEQTVALAGCTVRVEAGRCVALLGPSGSGKTTLLHTVAGFIRPDHGVIRIAGREVAAPGRLIPPERRRIGLVFQSYALWPHLSVRETVAYPLIRRGVGRTGAAREAETLLDLLGIGALAARHPAALSGGQQQRVGLARALAATPDLFLFDEPTANLDAALKATFQAEIARQQRSSGAGALYVTHDPQEAFAVADRVVILRDGRIVQEDVCEAVYMRPANVWVAALTGGYSTFTVEVVGRSGDDRTLRIGAHLVTCHSDAEFDAPVGTTVCALTRPEWVRLAGTGDHGAAGQVRAVRYGGPHTEYTLDTAVGAVIAREDGPPRHAPGAALSWWPMRTWLLLPESLCPEP